MKLNELMSANKLTQYKLAEILQVSPAAIYKYQQGKAEPSISKLIKLADYFGCSVDYLIDHQTANTLQLDGMSDAQKQLISIVMKLNPEQTNFAIGYFSNALGLPYAEVRPARPF